MFLLPGWLCHTRTEIRLCGYPVVVSVIEWAYECSYKIQMVETVDINLDHAYEPELSVKKGGAPGRVL